MNWRLGVCVAAVGLAVLTGSAWAQASPAASGEPSPLTRPIWDRRPTLNDVVKVYPRKLYPDGRQGQAAISCRVNDEGRLADCSVVEESEPGFGDAALKLSKSFRMKPRDQLGEPVAGRVIRVPFRLSR